MMGMSIKPIPNGFIVGEDGGLPCVLSPGDKLNVTFHDNGLIILHEILTPDDLQKREERSRKIIKWKRRLGWFLFTRYRRKFNDYWRRPNNDRYKLKISDQVFTASSEEIEWPDVIE